METTNDSSTVGTETTEEREVETTETKESTNDLTAVLDRLEQMNADIASLKRSAKKAVKTETPKKTETDNSDLLETVNSLKLQVAGITDPGEVKLVNDLREETGLSLDKLIGSNYFKTELESFRTERANAEATSNVKGDKSGGSTKSTADYWIAKGEYPSHEQVSDRKVRQEIRNALVAKEKGSSGGKFYNS